MEVVAALFPAPLKQGCQSLSERQHMVLVDW